MNPHAFYPKIVKKVDRIAVTHQRAMPTVRPWYTGWLLVMVCVFFIVAGAVLLVAKMHATQAQLDTAFLQGMQAGHQLCPRGL